MRIHVKLASKNRRGETWLISPLIPTPLFPYSLLQLALLTLPIALRLHPRIGEVADGVDPTVEAAQGSHLGFEGRAFAVDLAPGSGEDGLYVGAVVGSFDHPLYFLGNTARIGAVGVGHGVPFDRAGKSIPGLQSRIKAEVADLLVAAGEEDGPGGDALLLDDADR
jgi:hypothetical protein